VDNENGIRCEEIYAIIGGMPKRRRGQSLWRRSEKMSSSLRILQGRASLMVTVDSKTVAGAPIIFLELLKPPSGRNNARGSSESQPEKDEKRRDKNRRSVAEAFYWRARSSL